MTLLLVSLTFTSPTKVASIELPSTSDIQILILVADFFGWNYFDAKEYLESWGVNVTTVAYSLDYDIDSCLNREPRPIVADLLISEMTPEMISQFDSLLITSGGHWAGLVANETVLNFISMTYDLGLIVGSICTGTRVVAEANDIVNGSKVVSFTLSSPQMVEAGAKPIYGVEAVADGRIITGGRGGGTGGEGWFEAPTSETCAEIVRSVLGLSRVNRSLVSPYKGPEGTNFTITMEISNLNDTLGDILSTSVDRVTAEIYAFGNRTLVDTIELIDDNQDGNYTGNFIGLFDGDYVVDLEIEDSNETIEVVRELESFAVGVEPTKPIDIVLVSTITGGSVIIILLVVALVKKK
ncbi:MAG: DJ-1/PfpI family protein [Candidatus Thorarchaeota archaeon]